MLEITCIKDIENNSLRWFRHVHRRYINVIIRRIHCLEVINISMRQRRPIKTWLETVKNDFKTLLF